MTSFKTTKVADELVVKVQSMFPNCEKYKSCCIIDKDFWNNIQNKLKELKKAKIETVYQTPRRERVKLEHTKPPEGFENCTDTLLAFLQLQKNLGN